MAKVIPDCGVCDSTGGTDMANVMPDLGVCDVVGKKTWQR